MKNSPETLVYIKNNLGPFGLHLKREAELLKFTIKS